LRGVNDAADSPDHLRAGFGHLQLVLAKLGELATNADGSGRGGSERLDSTTDARRGLLDEESELVENRAVAHRLDIVEHHDRVRCVREIVEQREHELVAHRRSTFRCARPPPR
jgi:hypothetical protein